MNIDALKVARFFATVKHAGQLYSGVPYTHHLAAVEATLRRFGPSVHYGAVVSEFDAADEVLLVAAWLHDAVEDTGTKVKEIAEMFGEDVAKLVAAVTDEPGDNRKIRKALTYPKIRAAGRLAVRLKLADRIANIEAGGTLSDMYRKEQEDFRRALHTPGENEDMWKHLDGLLTDDEPCFNGNHEAKDGRCLVDGGKKS
jgi:(p)ppGpp synthase/HD superfamily hydrolase